MNNVSLVGNLTKGVDLRSTTSGTAVCQFSVAVQRRYKNSAGEYEADFINCVAWRQAAESISKYFTKGSKIGVVGHIETRKYEGNDGKTHYATEVVVDNWEFVERKSFAPGNDAPANDAPSVDENGMTTIDDTELPF